MMTRILSAAQPAAKLSIMRGMNHIFQTGGRRQNQATRCLRPADSRSRDEPVAVRIYARDLVRCQAFGTPAPAGNECFHCARIRSRVDDVQPGVATSDPFAGGGRGWSFNDDDPGQRCLSDPEKPGLPRSIGRDTQRMLERRNPLL